MAFEIKYRDIPSDPLEELPPIGKKCFHGNEVLKCKVYKRRWLTLLIYILFCTVSSSQWTQYAIINNVVTRYYKVDSIYVDWTAIIYMAVYVPAIIPALMFLEKKVQYNPQISPTSYRYATQKISKMTPGMLRRVVWQKLIALMMEAARTSETSVNFYQTTRCNIREDKSSSYSPPREHEISTTQRYRLISINFPCKKTPDVLSSKSYVILLLISCKKTRRRGLGSIVFTFKVRMFASRVDSLYSFQVASTSNSHDIRLSVFFTIWSPLNRSQPFPSISLPTDPSIHNKLFLPHRIWH
jgi:hypothetical protein